MNARLLAGLGAGLLAVVVAVAFAFTSNAENTSSRSGPRPIAGLTSEVVEGVPDARLERAARAFFTSLIERTYRGQPAAIASATRELADRLQATTVSGSPTSTPTIAGVRFIQRARGVREVTVRVDEGLPDQSTQPLSAYFREIDGTWRAVGMRTLDDVAPDASSNPQAAPTAAPVAATRAVRAYALAARSWTPDTLEAQYREQLRLADGRLRRELERYPPSAAQIRAYRADDARSQAEIADLQVVRLTATEITYSVVLQERTTAGGATSQQRTVNTAELRLVRGRWLVSRFTESP